ncbi:MAG TPA: hypothetical protein VF521_06470 [Pyrinomonadaceae bacterium]|jgi:hypothetical protein
MITPSRRRLFVITLVAAVAASLAAVAYANHSWGSYHWARTGNPFTVKLGDNLSANWKPYLKTTSTDWSKSSVLDTTIVAGQSSARRCPATTGRVEVCNNTYGNNGWLGIASISASGSHITAGTVKLNDSYFNTAKYNTSAWRNMVTCQEVGHTFGLDHQDENFSNLNLGTCMDYTNDPTGTAGTNGPLNNEHPNQHDYDQLVTIYNHSDSTTTVGLTAAQRAAMDNGEWGRLVRSTNGGRTALFENDLGGGHKVFTFVTWADPEDAEGHDEADHQ